MMAGIHGRNTAPELAVRCIARRIGLCFCLHPKDNRLPDPDERNDGPDGGLPSHGTNAFGVAVPQPCHADGGGSDGIPRCARMRHRNTMMELP